MACSVELPFNNADCLNIVSTRLAAMLSHKVDRRFLITIIFKLVQKIHSFNLYSTKQLAIALRARIKKNKFGLSTAKQKKECECVSLFGQ